MPSIATNKDFTNKFNSIYNHGFVRVAVGIPFLKVADPEYNTKRILGLAQNAADQGAVLTLFPELCICAYSNEDLFQQDALLEATLASLKQILNESHRINTVLLVGAPLQINEALYNCAIVVYQGQILGVVPKTYLPNYREFYEKRQFTSGLYFQGDTISLFNQEVPFGNNIVFKDQNLPYFKFYVEICEDVWTPLPPSTFGALAGATIIANLSASNITIGKAEYRKNIVSSQSAKCLAAYLYSAAGPGESTTDLAWDGHALIYENGDFLAESDRFCDAEQLISTDIDLERLVQDRLRTTSFNDCRYVHQDHLKKIQHTNFHFEIPVNVNHLKRNIERFPFVPSDARIRDERCYEAYNIQVHGLMKRIASIGVKKLVIGISGGLDSTHALIVCAKAMDRLNYPRENILAYTMPGFATSKRTHNNAVKLMAALGVKGAEIDIRPACLQMMKDIHHPFASGEPLHDVTFENVQAGERTSHLFRLANMHNAIVVGTGDLSELALGWTTFGVGDHMAHYNVNASVPKTLIQYLITWVIQSNQFDAFTDDILQSILDTEISPELVPEQHKKQTDQPSQRTEDIIGPYELQDFNLYYVTRFGFKPSKIVFLSYHAWHQINDGLWPDFIPVEKRHAYELTDIVKWLKIFLFRFFKLSQFKRSTLPNGPKVGSGGSLSPRGDWRAPSDAEADVWLNELNQFFPDDQMTR